MKAIYIKEPGKVAICETAMPVRKPGEALLKVLYGGICGSDLGSYRGTFAYFEYPRIPGHEFSAEIVEIDENEYGLKTGMTVTCNPYFNCNACYSCRHDIANACMDNRTMGCQRDGAFCEYITMPIDRIYDGKGLPPRVLAAIEPFCISYHGVRRAGIKKGDKVLVIGAGMIGVLAAAAARTLCEEVYISDVQPQKLEYVQEKFGFAGTILNDSRENFKAAVAEITGTSTGNKAVLANGFDVCIEAVGLPSTFQDAVDGAAFGGKVVLIGVGKKNLDFDFTLLQKKELNVFGSRNAQKRDFLELIELVKEGKADLEKVITNVYKADHAALAFKDFDASVGDMLKVMIQF